MPFNSKEHSAEARGEMLGKARPAWLRVTESEQRMIWLKNMIRKRIDKKDNNLVVGHWTAKPNG